MQGFVHSVESFGTVDGPGVRMVIFLQGCPMRCAYCHNPDTWVMTDGSVYDVETVVERICRYRTYFGEQGGVTASGGEPLCQAEFLCELFALCRDAGIGTCLDTSGCMTGDAVEKLLSLTDVVLLDIKYQDDEKYQKHAGMKYSEVVKFLDLLEKLNVSTVIRRVIIPGLNDTAEAGDALAELARRYSCVKKTELLPFKKMCQMKYDKMGIEFPFAHISEPSPDAVMAEEERLNELIK